MDLGGNAMDFPRVVGPRGGCVFALVEIQLLYGGFTGGGVGLRRIVRWQFFMTLLD